MRTLWVGQLADGVTEDMLLAAFRPYGELASWRLIRPSHCAFLDFASHKSAADALQAMNGKALAGHVSDGCAVWGEGGRGSNHCIE
jgi:RNA recognition motif-containing protein